MDLLSLSAQMPDIWKLSFHPPPTKKSLFHEEWAWKPQLPCPLALLVLFFGGLDCPTHC
jgi:hypothetical protein